MRPFGDVRRLNIRSVNDRFNHLTFLISIYIPRLWLPERETRPSVSGGFSLLMNIRCDDLPQMPFRSVAEYGPAPFCKLKKKIVKSVMGQASTHQGSGVYINGPYINDVPFYRSVSDQPSEIRASSLSSFQTTFDLNFTEMKSMFLDVVNIF